MLNQLPTVYLVYNKNQIHKWRVILMGKSNAQKRREKLVREGRRNPENSRSSFAQLDLRTQRTKNKKDLLYRSKHKNRNPKHWEDDSYFFALYWTFFHKLDISSDIVHS